MSDTPDMFAAQTLAEGLVARSSSSPYEPTLRIVRKEMFRKAESEATPCPCCSRLVKIYRRKLNASMALALIYIYKEKLKWKALVDAPGAKVSFKPDDKISQGDWIHVEKLLVREKAPTGCRGYFHKLRHFGLLEQKSEIRDDGSNRNGYWRITWKGTEFIEERYKVPSYAIFYNQELLALDGGNIGIRQAMGSKFSYEGLMNNS